MEARARSVVLAALLALGLAACGGAKNGAGADPKTEADLWSGYKGTYATAGAPRVGEASAATPSTAKKPEAKAKASEADSAEAEAEAALASSRKQSRGMINGESISTINAGSLANASKTALKGKVVSSNALVGSQYEQVNVQLKGASVQIVRPASSPSSTGPSIASPKSRHDSLGKADAAFYDEEADVVVIVNAGGKKAAAQKVLSSLVSR
ncbi:MAG: hypothetical protein JST00_33035 [Deltaproteobacteria bacterium]|nr:hypothetical protein [Deltaproteobacteria bacterium]